MGYYEEIKGSKNKSESTVSAPKLKTPTSSIEAQPEETRSEAYTNEWAAKLAPFAANISEYQKPFTKEQLGHGQFMSVEQAAKSIALSNSRKRAGDAALASSEADLSWAKHRVVTAKVEGKQLEFGIEKAKNVGKSNKLAYEVGRIGLEGEQYFLKLNQLNNKVQSLRQSVRVSAATIAIESGEQVEELNFEE